MHAFVHVCMCVHSCECMCSCPGVYMEVKGQLSRVKFQETSNSGHVTMWQGPAEPSLPAHAQTILKYGVL